MLVDLSAVVDVSERQKIARLIMEVLFDVTRDTDVKGWHVYGLVIGIIFTVTACEEATPPFVQGHVAIKCLGRLRSHFGVETFSCIQISWQSL